MTQALITGMHGTVAPILAEVLNAAGWETVGWDRQVVPPEDEAAGAAFISQIQPDWICHLALGAERWGAFLAEQARHYSAGFLFTSTVMVFSNIPDGPHHPADTRTSQEAYGRYKIRCEDQVQAANPNAIIGRIGWQIGRTRGGNHMLEALHQTQAQEGIVRCSTAWIPATSFLEDSCAGLLELMERREAGVYHLDSNARTALNYFQIVQKLKTIFQTNWVLEPHAEYVHDQRLLDDRISLKDLFA